jgi:hypothetical protein
LSEEYPICFVVPLKPVMPGEGSGLSSRPTQDAVRDLEIGQPSSLSDWRLVPQLLVVYGQAVADGLNRLAAWQRR